MEEIEVEVKSTIKKYKTEDGETFTNKCDAEKWEKELQSVAYSRISDKIKEVEVSGAINAHRALGIDDAYIYIFSPETENDIDHFLMYLKLTGYWIASYDNKLCTSDMKAGEKYVVFRDANSGDYVSVMSSRLWNDLIRRANDKFNEIMNM